MPFTCAGVEWKKVKTLGKGSFGEAHLIQSIGADPARQAVVKLVNLSSMSSNERKDANNEVSVLSRLKHPNIVGYIGSFEAEGSLHIVMEYCNAGDVEALVKRQGNTPMSEESVASLFIQTAHALRYMHDRRIMHRDLKSQNIFLHRKTPDGPYIAKLGDFGISTMLKNTLAMAKTVCGTPYYFSPELCLNRPYNNKSDIWSLGIILYELAALKHAFDANSMKGLMQRILQGRYDPVPKIYHKSLTVLLDGMLHQKVDRRFDIGKVLASDFVKQHSERMQIAHDLAKTVRSGEDGSMRPPPSPRGGGKNVVDPRFQVPLANAMQGIARNVQDRPVISNYDERDSKAMLKRLAADKDRDTKRMALDDQRRRRRIEAARNYDRHRDERAMQQRRVELDRLDDIRRRVEICSWEDQQKYIDEGWKFVQETKQRQDKRQWQHFDTDKQLREVRSQMEAIEAKMKERRGARASNPTTTAPVITPTPTGAYEFVAPPYTDRGGPPLPQSRGTPQPSPSELAKMYKHRVSGDAPWNRNREFPIGFTKETWEAYKNGPPQGIDGNAVPAPIPKRPLDMRQLRMLGTARVVTDYDVDALLEEEEGTVVDELLRLDPAHKARMDAVQADRAKLQGANEWEEHRRRIALARKAPLPTPSTQQQHQSAGVAPTNNRRDSSLSSELTEEEGEEESLSIEEEEEDQGFSGPDDHLDEVSGGSAIPVNIPIPLPPTRASPQPEAALLNVVYRSRDSPNPLPPTQQHQQSRQKQGKQNPPSRPQAVASSSSAPPVESVVGAGDPYGCGYGFGGQLEESFEGVLAAMRVQEALPPPQEMFGDDGWDTSNEEEEVMFRKMYGLAVPPSPTPPPNPQKVQPPEQQIPPTRPSRMVVVVDEGEPMAPITEETISQFSLDGRPLLLPKVTPSSTLAVKTAALQQFLVEALGGKRSFKRLHDALEDIQGAEVSEADANEMVVRLERQYGTNKPLVDLMMQLMVCEGVLQEGPQ